MIKHMVVHLQKCVANLPSKNNAVPVSNRFIQWLFNANIKMDFRTRQEEERIKLQQQLAQQQLKKHLQSADFSRSDSAYDSISGSISELKAVPSDSLTSFQSIDETVDEIFSTKSDASEFYGGKLILSPL